MREYVCSTGETGILGCGGESLGNQHGCVQVEEIRDSAETYGFWMQTVEMDSGGRQQWKLRDASSGGRQRRCGLWWPAAMEAARLGFWRRTERMSSCGGRQRWKLREESQMPISRYMSMMISGLASWRGAKITGFRWCDCWEIRKATAQGVRARLLIKTGGKWLRNSGERLRNTGLRRRGDPETANMT